MLMLCDMTMKLLNVSKNKGTIKCDKRIVICNINTA